MQIFRRDRNLTSSWDLVQPSINLVRENIWPVFYLSFLPSLVTVVGIVLSHILVSGDQHNVHIDTRSYVGLIIALVGGIWSVLTYPGLLILQLKATTGEHPTATECFKKGIRRLIPFTFMSIIAGITIALGFLAFVVPGLILLRGLYLAQYYIVGQELSPLDALKKSFEQSKSVAGYIWGTIFVEMVFSVLGYTVGKFAIIGYVLSLLVGLMYLFGPALRYNEVSADLHAKHKKASSTKTK